MTGWIFFPALILMAVYGLLWFVLGLIAADPLEGDWFVVVLWIVGNVVFGYPIYLGLVEVAG